MNLTEPFDPTQTTLYRSIEEKGIEKGKLQVALAMLQEGMSLDAIQRITKLDETLLWELKSSQTTRLNLNDFDSILKAYEENPYETLMQIGELKGYSREWTRDFVYDNLKKRVQEQMKTAVAMMQEGKSLDEIQLITQLDRNTLEDLQNAPEQLG